MSHVWFAVRVTPTPAPPTTAQANACHGRSTNAKPAKPSALARLLATRMGLGWKRSSRTPEGGVATVPAPRIAPSTTPAVAVEKPRNWCR
jgi:hypothetical protein